MGSYPPGHPALSLHDHLVCWRKLCTVMSAYKVPLHRVFDICKTRFYLPWCIRKRDYHTAFSQYTQYVRHNHSIYNAIFNISRVTCTQSMLVGAVRAIYIMFGSDSSKSTILFRFLTGAKTNDPPGPPYWRNPIWPPPG